jgi:Domain of unknown function (DUF6907)
MSLDFLRRWRESVQRYDALASADGQPNPEEEEEGTVRTRRDDCSGTFELAHPTWCTACEVRMADGELFGCHSTPPIRIDADDQIGGIRVSVTQFVGNFGEVAEPAVRVEGSPGAVVWLHAQNADRLAAALTEAAVMLRGMLKAGDYLPVCPSARD